MQFKHFIDSNEYLVSADIKIYSEYIGENIALPRIVTLENGYDLPILLWTAKGRDFIFDLAEREMPRWYA